MAVPIQLEANGQAVDTGAPIPLFTTQVGGAVQPIMGPHYVVAPDGQRFLMNTLIDEPASPFTIILNWQSALGARER